ncbi:MAG: hypothetical protein J5J00_06310 [Deltaproteobacteria bacterium]|nr:hypothetical protein [Deltaproteobacteria bacterium]
MSARFLSKPPLMLALLSVCLLLFYIYWYDFALYAKILLQFPAGGASFWKQYFYLGWLIVFSLALYFFRSPIHFASRFVLIPIFLLAVVGIIAHFHLVLRLALAPLDYSVVVDKGLVSSQQLFHSHVMKGMVGWLAKSVYTDFSLRADAGLPYLTLLPGWFFAISLALFIASVLSVLLVLKAVCTDKCSVLKLFILATLGFYIVRPLVDGGAFSSEFVAAAGPFTALALARRVDINKWAGVILAVFALLIDHLFRSEVLPESVGWVIKDSFMHLCFIAAMLFLIHETLRPIAKASIAFLLFIAAGYLNRGHFIWHELKHMNEIHPAGTEVIITSDQGLDYPGQVINSDAPVKIFSHRLQSETSLWHLFAMYHSPPGYFPAIADGKGCRVTEHYRVTGTIHAIGEDRNIIDCAGGVAESLAIHWYPSAQDLRIGRYEGRIFGCISNSGSYTLARRLTNCGLTQFTLTPDK